MIIGTRSSKLALWQANLVLRKLQKLDIKASIKKIESEGDRHPNTPLSQLGTTGIFTSALDTAVRSGNVDIAVHSMKDYPTHIPEEITIAAIMKREQSQDVIVLNPNKKIKSVSEINTLATGSIRRRAQWLSKYPEAQIFELRGNVPTRIQKLKESNWDAIILAFAGIKRLNLTNELELMDTDWMIPAPAQGTIIVTCRSEDLKTIKILKNIEDEHSRLISSIERKFLNALEGGCSMPIGALATLHKETLRFQAGLYTQDGAQSYVIDKTCNLKNVHQNLNEWIKEFKSSNVHKILKT